MSAPGDDPIEVAAEVAGTPEQVWEQIATAQGISAWFMPAEVDARAGGAISQRHAPGDDGLAHGTISAYEPPHRFVYEEAHDGETVATEFLVETRSGGTCVVRIVTHGISADDDAADNHVSGWTLALATLAVRLDAFAREPAGFARVWARSAATLDDAWDGFAAATGLAGARPGDRVEATAGPNPPFAGTVAAVLRHGAVVRVEEPRAGVLRLAGTGFGGATSIVVDRYVYGDGADAEAAAEGTAWTAYLRA